VLGLADDKHQLLKIIANYLVSAFKYLIARELEV
jgi:hypothetical protein